MYPSPPRHLIHPFAPLLCYSSIALYFNRCRFGTSAAFTTPCIRLWFVAVLLGLTDEIYDVRTLPLDYNNIERVHCQRYPSRVSPFRVVIASFWIFVSQHVPPTCTHWVSCYSSFLGRSPNSGLPWVHSPLPFYRATPLCVGYHLLFILLFL
jgi:hypothetical protein